MAQSYFVTVPEGAKALRSSMSGLAPEQPDPVPRLPPVRPAAGQHLDAELLHQLRRPSGNGCDPNTRTYANPTPGVWEILVESRRTSPLLDNPFTLTAGVVGVQVDPASQTVPERRRSARPTPLELEREEHCSAGVTATGRAAALSARPRRPRPTIADGDQQTYTVVVPAGATKLDVSIGNTSDKAADLDLFVTGPRWRQAVGGR